MLADDFDSNSHSIHSLGQKSRLADNMQDDADKYDFADNYQQTQDDVNPQQIEESRLVQQSEADDLDNDVQDDADDQDWYKSSQQLPSITRTTLTYLS